MTFSSPTIPAAGQRVGVVDGPGQFAEHNAGTVLCQIEDRWGTHALVLMDTGKTATCEGLNHGPGIGWHLLTSAFSNVGKDEQ